MKRYTLEEIEKEFPYTYEIMFSLYTRDELNNLMYGLETIGRLEHNENKRMLNVYLESIKN